MKVAQRFDCEIINCDSRQIYQEMNIGTAKPDHEDFKQIRHHLFDIVKPDTRFNAGEYMLKATETIRQIIGRKKIPLLTGGTGFYYSAVSEGLPAFEGNPETAQMLQKIFEEKGLEELQNLLFLKDPEAYGNIDLMNPRRVIRALEIVIHTGRPFSMNRPEPPLKEAAFFPVVVSRPREILHARIESRVDQMLKNGLEKEVKSLIKKYGETAPGLNSIGYSEWFPFFKGIIEIKQLREEIIVNSRQYAKRQETWFKKRPGVPIRNLEAIDSERKIFDEIKVFLKQFAL
ncbi:MAG: tRNA (adenosine(37)-N6)-dimethylallyltransferase MiaA [Candidatus Rifleibacteriota bacterium]